MTLSDDFVHCLNISVIAQLTLAYKKTRKLWKFFLVALQKGHALSLSFSFLMVLFWLSGQTFW